MKLLMQKEKYHLGAVIICSLFFLPVYFYLNYATIPESGERIFNSPDESANYQFAKNFAQESVFHMPVSLNASYGNIVHPRSVTVQRDGSLAPGSFLGIVLLYGSAAKVLGSQAIPYMTPIVSFFAVLAFYFFTRKIFGKNPALFSALLLLILPSWWYYNSRSMFHNILFIDFFIFSVVFLLGYLKKKRKYLFLLSLLFFGLAAITRSSEMVWLVFLYFGILWTERKRVGRDIFVAIFFLIFIVSMLILTNSVVYSRPISGGYGIASDSVLETVAKGFFPFGIRPIFAMSNFFKYFFILQWWLFVPLLFSLVLYALRYRDLSSEKKAYVISFLGVSSYLVLYYGSWSIADSIGGDGITIGTSYMRYWIFMFIFSLPLISDALLFAVKKKISGKRARVAVLGIFVLLSAWFSSRLVFFGTAESVLAVSKNIRNYYEIRNAVSDMVPDNAIIVTDRSDKIFFPTYRVVVFPNDPNTVNGLVMLIAAGNPVYYYTHRSDDDIREYEDQLLEHGLKIQDGVKIFANEQIFVMSAYE